VATTWIKAGKRKIRVMQPGDRQVLVLGSADKVLQLASGDLHEGLYCEPYKAMKMLRLRQAEVLEES
jgi:hypothetical protein